MSRSRLVPCWLTTGPGAASVVSRDVAPILHGQAGVDGFVRLGYPLQFVTLSEPVAPAEGGRAVLAGVPDPLPPRLQRMAH
jgi:hypothetical protein